MATEKKICATLWEQSTRDNNNSYSYSNSNDNKNKN